VAANVVVDTGPLVALIDASEARHRWAIEQFARLRPPLLTCEAVLSEAAFLLRRAGLEAAAIPTLAARGVLERVSLIDTEATEIARLMTKYSRMPMSFADACLVRMVELTPHGRVMTLDADFAIYRQRNRRVIPTIMP
jgi:uncharacterized protein